VEILDAQTHMWLSDRPTRPWSPAYRDANRENLAMLIHAGQSMGPETLLLEMAEAGVDGAVLSPTGVYGADNSFELEAARQYPRKFCVVGWIDHLAPDVVETLEADVADGMVGVRILGFRDPSRVESGEFDAVLKACDRLGCAVSIPLVHPVLEGVLDVLRRYDGVQFTVDHLGVGFAPPLLGPVPDDPWVNLPAVLDLSRYPNVAMKLTGVAALSQQRFPFPDVHEGVRCVIDAFGVDRVMWGTDFTRTAGLHSYWDGVHYLAEIDGLSTSDLEILYGGALRKAMSWNPDPHQRPRP
jgi:L-fuconolactonase